MLGKKVPVVEEKAQQQKIAAVLSALDAKIDCNNRINAELEAMAKTLRKPLPEDVDFMHASREEMIGLRKALIPLTRRLAVRLARKRRHNRKKKVENGVVAVSEKTLVRSRTSEIGQALLYACRTGVRIRHAKGSQFHCSQSALKLGLIP